MRRIMEDINFFLRKAESSEEQSKSKISQQLF